MGCEDFSSPHDIANVSSESSDENAISEASPEFLLLYQTK